MVRETDDGTVFERLACIRYSGGEHIGKHNRMLLEKTPVDTKGSIPGQEDDVTIFEPEVGIASKGLLFRDTMASIGTTCWFICTSSRFLRSHGVD